MESKYIISELKERKNLFDMDFDILCTLELRLSTNSEVDDVTNMSQIGTSVISIGNKLDGVVREDFKRYHHWQTSFIGFFLSL